MTIKRWKRIGDLLLEVVIAVLLVTAEIAYIATHPRADLNWGRAAVGANTLVVFGFLIAWFRRYWGRVVFWATLSVLLVGHVAAYLYVLRSIEQFPLSYYVILNAGELAVLGPVVEKINSMGRETRG